MTVMRRDGFIARITIHFMYNFFLSGTVIMVYPLQFISSKNHCCNLSKSIIIKIFLFMNFGDSTEYIVFE